MGVDMGGPKWSARELAMANTIAIEGLWKYVFVHGLIETNEKLQALLGFMISDADKTGDPRVALALRETFAKALSGEWDRVRTLAKNSSTGSA